MSIGVMPIQTDVEGGTMHTVGFAEKQGRLVVCPEPPVEGEDLPMYRGVAELLRSGRAEAIQPDAIDALITRFRSHAGRLLHKANSTARESGGNSPDEGRQLHMPLQDQGP